MRGSVSCRNGSYEPWNCKVPSFSKPLDVSAQPIIVGGEPLPNENHKHLSLGVTSHLSRYKHSAHDFNSSFLKID
jgi:hypothetical protein